MKYIKKFENLIETNLYDILDSAEIFSEQDSKDLIFKIRNAIRYGADVNEIGWLGRTPLIYTAIYTCNKYTNAYAIIAKELINAGADVNIVDDDNRSALLWSVDRSHYDVMNILIESDADWGIIDRY